MITITQTAAMLGWIIGYILAHKDNTWMDNINYAIGYLIIGIPLFMLLNFITYR